jgi:hypothetical protein
MSILELKRIKTCNLPRRNAKEQSIPEWAICVLSNNRVCHIKDGKCQTIM